MSRRSAGSDLIVCLVAGLLLVAGSAFAEPDAAADGESAGDYEHADDESPDYVDIDSYGLEEDAEEGSEGAAGATGATAATVTTGAAAAGAGAASTASAATPAEAAPGGDAGPQSFGGQVSRMGEVAMDAAILRPFGAVATGVGCGFLAAAAPFLVFSNDYDTASDVFVGERYRYTFERPLGSF